jgi:hypothetical protein
VEVKGGGRELRRRWKRARVGVELTLRAPMATGKSGQVKTGLLVFICDLGGGVVCGATGGSLLAPGNSWRGQLHCCGGTGHGSRAHVCRGDADDGAMATWAARGRGSTKPRSLCCALAHGPAAATACRGRLWTRRKHLCKAGGATQGVPMRKSFR